MNQIAFIGAYKTLTIKKQEVRIMFKRDEYDPFIDFLKGVCIVFVILTHSFPSQFVYYSLFVLWGKAAVPLFLLIQVFHTYKKSLNDVNFNFKKIYFRIIKPFLFVQLVIITLFAPNLLPFGSSHTISDYLISIAKHGGKGSGAYYPWIYVQFAIILPLFVPVFKKFSGIGLAVFFLLLSQVIEFFCSLVNIPEWSYRLLCLRYVFLIYLGYLLATKGIPINPNRSLGRI